MAVPTPQVDILSEPRIVEDEHGGGSRSAEFVAQGAEAVANFVGEQRVENIGKGLSAELDQTTSDWWEANRQTALAPNIADVFDVDPQEVADAPAPVQALMQEVAKQRLASEQGAISATELRVRHESTLRKYLNRYPQLTEQIMAVSGQTLGYNPLGAHIDAMVEQLNADSSGNSEEWAALDRYADAVGVNMTLKTVAPVQYYTQVMAFAQRDTEYEYM